MPAGCTTGPFPSGHTGIFITSYRCSRINCIAEFIGGGSAHSRAAPHSDAAEFAAVPFGRTAVQLAVDEQSLTLLNFVL